MKFYWQTFEFDALFTTKFGWIIYLVPIVSTYFEIGIYELDPYRLNFFLIGSLSSIHVNHDDPSKFPKSFPTLTVKKVRNDNKNGFSKLCNFAHIKKLKIEIFCWKLCNQFLENLKATLSNTTSLFYDSFAQIRKILIKIKIKKCRSPFFPVHFFSAEQECAVSFG